MKPSSPLAAWIRLFARSPEDLAAEKQARHPSPAPHRKDAQQGPKQAPQRIQAGGVLPVPHLSKRRPENG